MYSRADVGMTAPLVRIEVHLSTGLPAFHIVGLAQAAVKESRDRVRSALMNNGFFLPSRRITVSLAPADLPKAGARFDLAIAVGILQANGDLAVSNLSSYEFLGELSLSGELHAVSGALPFVLASQAANKQVCLPLENADEVSVVTECQLYPAQHFIDVVRHLSAVAFLPPLPATQLVHSTDSDLDMADVQGQLVARRALEIAACGNHSLLMQGPPGSGKTMLASRLVGLLPPLTLTEALETAAVYSIAAGQRGQYPVGRRPYRSPHHSASSVALVGGGSSPQPGEISLAHHGVLFLDELPEFSRSVLESLREPLEQGEIHLSRAAWQARFPADFQLVAAMNPCPCGYLTDSGHECRCTPDQVQRYLNRVSGPLLDRIDLHVTVARVPATTLLVNGSVSESSAAIGERVICSRQRQLARQGKLNSALTAAEALSYCLFSNADRSWLTQLIDQCNLSARACHRVIKVARSLADSELSDRVRREHIEEAMSFRC